MLAISYTRVQLLKSACAQVQEPEYPMQLGAFISCHKTCFSAGIISFSERCSRYFYHACMRKTPQDGAQFHELWEVFIWHHSWAPGTGGTGRRNYWVHPLSPHLIIMLQTISGMLSASGYTAAMFCFVMSFSSANKPRQKFSPWSYYLAFHGRLVNSKVEVAKEQECSVELLSTKLFWNLKVRDRQEDDLNNYMNRNLSRSPLLRICYLS